MNISGSSRICRYRKARRFDDIEEVGSEREAKQADGLGDIRIKDTAFDRLGSLCFKDQMRPPRGGDEENQAGIGPEHRTADFLRSDGLRVRLAGIHQRRTPEDLEQAIGEAVEVEQQIGRQRMPERHPAEHQDDDREDDGDVDEEVGDEGIQCN